MHKKLEVRAAPIWTYAACASMRRYPGYLTNGGRSTIGIPSWPRRNRGTVTDDMLLEFINMERVSGQLPVLREIQCGGCNLRYH